MLRIHSNEGHGRFDKRIDGEELLVPICRLRHPKFPLDHTEFVFGFSQDEDEEVVKKAKKDYSKIKKYLLRISSGENYQNGLKWRQFTAFTFKQFLYEAGMFEDSDFNDPDKLAKARERYLTALRCDVKSSGILILRRATKDIFTNNYNKNLIKLHQANMDIQFICDEYAVVEYICNYITKNEQGLSATIKSINDEAISEGEETLKTIKKIGSALDKGRECSIQEAIYRSLGLKMTYFNDVVRFVNTNHPERREGLLKSNVQELEDDDNVFHNSIHDYYENRPHYSEFDDANWDAMCLADFVSDYNIVKKQKNAIMLLDEKSFIIKRRRKAVLRYFLKYQNEEEYYRALCILFLPFRREIKDIHSKDVKLLYLENEILIEENRNKYEKHKVIMELVENAEVLRENMGEESDEESEYIEEETTKEIDIKDFEKSVKNQAKKMIENYYAGKEESMTENEHRVMVNQLNIQQRRIYNDFAERIKFHSEGDRFYLYIGGEAGTGKSFLLKCMIEAAKSFGKHSGQELDKPVCLTLAPTGVAAFLVNGVTIESGLALQPSQRNYVQNPSSRNSNLRFLYEDLLCICLDEVSMVGSDMLAKMNYRLQEIMGNSLFMGGISVICCGDFGQLPPIGQKMIWETSHLDGRIDISDNHWNNFSIFYLTEKMRSQDNEFSLICDKVRDGITDEQVIKYLEGRVKKCENEDCNEQYASGKLSIIVTSNEERNRINSEKLEKLLPGKKRYFVHASDKSLNNPNAPSVSDKLPLTRTGQLPKVEVFKEDCPVMITSNHPKAQYKNNGICNGARGRIDSIQTSLSDPDVAEVIWVKFNNPKVGQLLRLDSQDLLEKHKPNDPLAVPITRQKKQFFVKGNTEYMRNQFPLTLAYAVTSHKSQGQTLEEVIVDFSGPGRINDGSFYTAISRVKKGSSLYLKDFKISYIKANPEVAKKMKAMQLLKPYNFMKIHLDERVFLADSEEIKLAYLNIDNLFTAMALEMINNDDNLLNLDYLVISDTRAQTETSNEVLDKQIPNWSIVKRFDSSDKLKHMGMIVLRSKRSLIECNAQFRDKQYTQKNFTQMQVVYGKFKEFDLNVAFVYVRETPSYQEVRMLQKDLELSQLVMGDLNIDSNRSPDDEKLKLLCTTRSRLLTELTTHRFNQLDHVLLDTTKFDKYYSTSYINFSSDHKVITVRIAKPQSEYDPAFLQKVNFNRDIETKVEVKGRNSKSSNLHSCQTLKQGNVASNLSHSSLEEMDEGLPEVVIKEEKNKVSVSTSNMDLSCLFSPNWLNDEVINFYLDILRKHDDTVFMYSSLFHSAFMDYGFQRVGMWYRRKYDLMSYKSFLIPVHHADHWYLIFYNKSDLIAYDPYNYPNSTETERNQQLLKNFQFLQRTLMNLKENYLKPLFDQNNQRFEEPSIQIKLPPSIPAQNNSYDCGVFLLTFAKYIVLRRAFDFSESDMNDIRDIIRKEIESKKIMTNLPRKRRIAAVSKLSAKKRKIQCETTMQRTFINFDGETCWLNSNLQLLLTVLDFEENVRPNGSKLWNQLVSMHQDVTSLPLDPQFIKETIIETEGKRISRDNVLPHLRCFALGPNIKEEKTAVKRRRRIGQQDAKDFYYCLDENSGSWLDVFNLFKIKTITKTVCSSCNYESIQQAEFNSENTSISLTCPFSNVDFKAYVEEQMNQYEVVQGWKDQVGCGKISSGKVIKRIYNISERKYIVIIIHRLMRFGNSIEINNTEIRIQENVPICLVDQNGLSASFKLLGVVHHTGNVDGNNQTFGHYRADVYNKKSGNWFRTSDAQTPIKLPPNGITKDGYIYLLKKID